MRKSQPKNDDKYTWTNHCIKKMTFYGLTEGRIRRIINAPKRTEEGIAENTVAVMQPASIIRAGGKESWKSEIWVMYQIKNQKSKIKNQNLAGDDNTEKYNKKTIISAWRYPAVTKPGREIVIPQDVLEELRNIK